MPHQSRALLHKDKIILPILYALAKGAVVISAEMLGNAAKASRSKSIRRWGYQIIEDAHLITFDDVKQALARLEERRRFSHAVWMIRKRRFVKLVRGKGTGEYVLTVTEAGRRYAARYELANMTIAPQDPWDGIWRVVLFDIPEKLRIGRDALRQKLRALEFFQFQKSAFILPYPCRDEIDVIVGAYGLAPYVTFFETRELGYQEARALAHFHLTPRKNYPSPKKYDRWISEEP